MGTPVGSRPVLMDEVLRLYRNESSEIANFLCKERSMVYVMPDLFCGDFPVTHTRELEIVVWTAFSALITTALIGNFIVMWIIVRFRFMHQSFNFFLFNMALADFLMASLNAGTTWTFNFYYDWWYGSFCQFNHFFGVAPTCISVFTMIVISHDRCEAVVKPLKKRAISRRRAFALIAVIWVLATALSLPSMLMAHVSTHYFLSPTSGLKKRTLCEVNFKYKFLYDNLLFVVQYAIPLLVLAYTYTRIYLAFRADKFPNSSRISTKNHLRDKQKVVKMLGIVVFIFMVCWLPYQLYHMFTEYFTADPVVGTYSYLFIYWLAMSACVYNPIIYCVFNKRFRLGFSYVFRCLPGVHFTVADRQQMFPEMSRSVLSVRMRQVSAQTSSTLQSSQHPPRKCSAPVMRMRSTSPTTASATELLVAN